jgi:hypothetical protein
MIYAISGGFGGWRRQAGSQRAAGMKFRTLPAAAADQIWQ